MHFFATVAEGSALQWAVTFAIFALLTVFELLAPLGARQPLASRLPGAGFRVLWTPVGVAIYSGYQALLASLGWQPVRTLDLNLLCAWAGPLAPLLVAILAAMIADLTFYWFHRAQHAVPWLWRLHAVHHSIRDMNAFNAYHHVSEEFVAVALRLAPLAWLNIHAEGAALVSALFTMQVTAIHSPTTLHAGPLRWLLADNRFHRIHHSLRPEHFDRNFAANFAFWDVLFGTAYFPRPDEWPDVGLAEVDEPQTVLAWLTLPFRNWGAPAPDAKRHRTAVHGVVTVTPIAPAEHSGAGR